MLDLDETLIHSEFTREKMPVPDMTISVTMEGGRQAQIFVKVRPYLTLFLIEMAKIFEIVVYTASLCKYADAVID